MNADKLRCPCYMCSKSPTSVTPALRDKLKEMEETLVAAGDGELKINSGIRCQSHNRSVGGSPSSRHLDGIAADLSTAGNSELTYKIVAAAIKAEIPFIEVADRHVHVDLREGPRRMIIGVSN